MRVIIISLFATLACTGIIKAATTIGTNISTDGALSVIGASTLTGALGVTGLTTLGNASTTLLSTSNTLYIGGDNGLVLSDGSILDSSGAISFGNSNLSTTGTLTVSGAASLATTTLSGQLNMGSYLILNIGNAGTDFTSAGGLALADALSVGGTLSVTGTSTLTSVVSNSLATPANYVVFLSSGTTYVRDGLDGSIDYSNAGPETAIEWAMNNLTSGRTWKEKVVVKGDYELTSVIDVPSYTILEVQGRLKPADDGFTGSAIIRNSDTTNGNTDIELIGGTIDGNKANIDVSTNNCVQIQGSSESLESKRIKINGWTISNCKNEGIQTFYTNDFIFTNNNISQSGDDGYSILRYSHNGTISNSVIWGGTSVTGGSSGIEIEDGSYGITISGNVAYGGTAGSSMGGISVVLDPDNAYEGSHDINIVGNTLTLLESTGIGVQNQRTTTRFYNINIIGNTSATSTSYGIYVMGNSTELNQNINITGNTVSGAGNSTTAIYGIHASYVKGINIVSNIVKESGSDGMRLFYVQQANVANNILVNNGNTDTTSSFGVNVATNANSSDITITGNDIYDTQDTKTQDGIQIHSATSNILITGNNVATVRANKISLNSGAIATVKNNIGLPFEGQICSSFTTVGNIGTGEDDLMSCALAAEAVAKNGDALEFTMAFAFAANANDKRVRIGIWDTTESLTSYIYDSGTQAENSTELIVKGLIIRAGTQSQRVAITTAGSTTLMDADFGDYITASRKWVNAITIIAKGTGTADNDVTQTMMQVKFNNAPAQ